MKAVQITAPRTAEIVEVEDPANPPEIDGQVRVRLERACLCGSDRPYWLQDFREYSTTPLLRQYFGPIPGDPEKIYPLETGLSIHECVGTVIESRSDQVREGDFVMALPYFHHGYFDTLHLPDERIVPLPADIVPKEEILMSQPLGTIIRAFDRLPNLTGMTVAVVGQGPIGLMMDRLLINYGAGRVFAVDKLDYRLEVCKRMGATDTINPDRADTAEAIREANGGELCDLVIEAVGHDELAIHDAVALVRQDGKLLQFGVFDTEIQEAYPADIIFRKNVTVYNSVGAAEPHYFALARDMIARGQVDMAPIVTHKFPMADAQHAYETFVGRKGNCIKVIIDFEAG